MLIAMRFKAAAIRPRSSPLALAVVNIYRLDVYHIKKQMAKIRLLPISALESIRERVIHITYLDIQCISREVGPPTWKYTLTLSWSRSHQPESARIRFVEYWKSKNVRMLVGNSCWRKKVGERVVRDHLFVCVCTCMRWRFDVVFLFSLR